MLGAALGQFWGRVSTLELFFWRNRLSAVDTWVVTLILIAVSNYWHLWQNAFVPSFPMPLGAQIATGLVGWIVSVLSPRLRLNVKTSLTEFIGLIAYLVCLSVIVAVVILFIVERTGTYDLFVDLWDRTNIDFRVGELVIVLLFVAIAMTPVLINTIRSNHNWKN